jgi:adenosine deaminase
VVAAIEDHPAEKIWRNGVSMSINTDGRALSDVTLTQEYDTMQRVLSWQKERLLQCNLEAVRHAFTSDEKKAALRERLLGAWRAQR